MNLNKGVMSHGELVVQFSKALTHIGEVLPRQELNAALYPTARMKEEISHLYAHFMKFLLQAVKWYEMSPAGRLFYAIRKPFELDLKTTMDEIAACSKLIDHIAVAANMAELRDVHIDVVDLQNKITLLNAKVSDFGISTERVLRLALGM
jgi:hypothetical protein